MLGEPEQFNFKGWNDETVYGYVVKPVNFDPNKTYPVAFSSTAAPKDPLATTSTTAGTPSLCGRWLCSRDG